IAEDEVRIGRNTGLDHRPDVEVFGRDVWLRQQNPVYIYLPITDANAVSWNSNHPLDVALARIERIMKDDDVTPLDGFKLVYKLVDKYSFLILQPRKHAGTFNLDGLIQKDDDEC